MNKAKWILCGFLWACFTLVIMGHGNIVIDRFSDLSDTDITTAASGDVLYWNGTDWVELAKGSDGEVLKLASGLPSWGTDNTGAGSGAFSDAADPAVLNTTSKDVVIGPNQVNTSKLTVDGDADQVQLTVQAFSTQTDSMFIAENDSGTEVFNIESTGDVKAQSIQDIDGPGTNWSINSAGAAVFSGGVTAALTGNADTATALAANGTNASAGNAILGVDASGNAEGAFDVWTEAENTAAGYIANVVEDTTPQLGGGLDAQSNDITSLGNAVFSTGKALQTGTTATNTLLLQAYDTDTGPAYTTFATLTAGTTPTMDLSTSVTVGSQPIVVDSDIGSTVQAYDADLDTWATITPGANVGTFLATPSSANLASAITDETGSGLAVFGTAPTITGMTIDGDTNVAASTAFLIGSTTQIATGNTHEFQVLGAAPANDGMTIGKWGANANAPHVDFVKSRNASIGSNTIVADNDKVGELRFFPDDGVDFATDAAEFYAEVDDASPAAGDIGMAFVWQQMPGGAGALRETLRLEAAGHLTMLAGSTLFMGGLLDATGAVDMDYGSPDVTDHTFTTDSTGDAEIVLPNDSIGPNEIDSTTGAYDFGGVTSLEVPNGTAPTTDAAGEIAIDTNSGTYGSIEMYGAVGSALIPAVKTCQVTIWDPDGIQGTEDAIPILRVETEFFPHGITILDIWLAADASNSGSYNLEEWTSPTDGAPTTIETVAFSAATTAEDNGTIDDGSIAAGSYVFVDLDTTALNWLHITFDYIVNEGA